eukprot:2343245-Amphidinium_carterae.1
MAHGLMRTFLALAAGIHQPFCISTPSADGTSGTPLLQSLAADLAVSANGPSKGLSLVQLHAKLYGPTPSAALADKSGLAAPVERMSEQQVGSGKSVRKLLADTDKLMHKVNRTVV